MRPRAGAWLASLGRSAGGWVALTIAASLLVCACVVGLHVFQDRSLGAATAIVRDLRLARIDLYQGVTHSLLGDEADSPWDPERGRVLIRQSLQEFRRSLQRIPGGPAADALQVQLEEFGRTIEAVHRKDPRAQLDLRVAFYRLNTAALQVDQQARNALVELRRDQTEAYWLVLSLAIALLGLISAAAVRLRLREAAAATARQDSERRLRESLALVQATLQSTDNGMLVAGPDGRLLLWNERLAQLPGGRAGIEQASEAAVLAAVALHAPPAEGEVPASRVVRRPDGSSIETHWQPMLIEGRAAGRAWSFRDVTERERALEDAHTREHELELRVRERTADLASAYADLQTFSDAVSHDLRTPLAAVDAFAQAVLRKYSEGLAPQGRHYLERVVAGAASMTAMIQGLLELSRHARAPVHRQPLDLGAMAREAFDLQAQALAGRRVEFVVQEGLQASADPVLVATLLQNLVGNAVKYSRGRDPARIEVGARRVAGELWFYVRDNGAGFDPAYAERLFKPFSRLHGADEFEGHGIGLATVSRIVARHGGRVWAEGVEGEGATFWFTLG
jgi:signal transduction histidine kinase